MLSPCPSWMRRPLGAAGAPKSLLLSLWSRPLRFLRWLPPALAGPQRGSGGKVVKSFPTVHKETTALRLFVTDRHRPSQIVTDRHRSSQPRLGACSLLTTEGRTGERKANQRSPLGPRSSPQPGGSSKNRSRGGMPPALPPLSVPFAPERGRPGCFQARARAPFFMRSSCRLFVGSGLWLASL